MSNQASINLQLLIWFKDPIQFYRDLYGEEPYSYQARVLKRLPDLRRMLLLAAGGTGKTKLLACIGLWLCVVYSYIRRSPYNVLILSGSLKQAKALYEFTSKPLQQDPILSQLVDGEILKSEARFKIGSIIRALPQSLKSTQGEHMHCTIIDEAAIVDDFTISDTYRIVGGFDDSKIILSGTPTEYNSLFVEMWEDERKYPDYLKTKDEELDPLQWARFSWSAMESNRFTQEEIEEAKKRLTEEDFNKFWLGKPYPLTNTVVPVKLIRAQSIGYERFKYNPQNKIGIIIFGVDYGMTDYSVLVINQLLDDDNDVGYMYRVIDCIEWRGQQYDNVHDWIAHYADIYKPDYVFVDLNPKGESERSIFKLMPKGYYTQAINLGSERSALQVRMKFIFEHKAIIIPQDFQALLQNVKTYTWDKTKGDDYVTALMLSLRDIKGTTSSDSFYYKIGKIRRPIRAMR